MCCKSAKLLILLIFTNTPINVATLANVPTNLCMLKQLANHAPSFIYHVLVSQSVILVFTVPERQGATYLSHISEETSVGSLYQA